MARQPLIDERRNRQDPQSKYIEDALSEAMTDDMPKSSAPDKSPRPKKRPMTSSPRPKARPVAMKAGGNMKDVPAGNKGLAKLPTEVRNNMGYKAYGGKMKKMKMGGKCRGMGAATRGGNFYKDG